MYLVDYHTHSDCSSDGHVPMRVLAEAALRQGLRELCVTDHFDCHEPRWQCERQAVQTQLAEIRELYGERLALPFGIEIGQGAQNPAAEQRALSFGRYDFIIGSLHNLRGEQDFCFLKFESEAGCHAQLARYFEELFEHVEKSTFDVLGHLSYPLRYMAGDYGLPVDFSPYRAEIAEIFRRLTESGRGIELNTSGLRQKIGRTMPEAEHLRLYRELGGEIITIGSDAHYAEHVGAGIREGMELLRECGFRYVCTYRLHKPEFIPIEI